MKTRKKFLIKNNVCLALAFVYAAFSLLQAQVNIEAVARLQAEVSTNSNLFFEGYSTIINGTYTAYESHRSGNKRDSSYAARTSGSESTVEWKTSSVPTTIKSNHVSFIWTCGFGNNLGKEVFDLYVNDELSVSFSTMNDGYWIIVGKNEVSLSFTTMKVNSNGANLGYMVLTVPQTQLLPDRSVKLKITGRLSSKEVWYRLYAYKNSKKYFLHSESKSVYTNLDFINMADAKLTAAAIKNYSGKQLKVMSKNKLIAEALFVKDGNISKSELIIPKEAQETFGLVYADKKLLDTISWGQINNKRIRAFMAEELVCDSYVFNSESFPMFHWKNPERVENEIGKTQINISYYDAKFQKVSSAEKNGRYGAVIEAETNQGFMIKRYVTLFRSNADFGDYSSNIPVQMNYLKDYGIPENKWKLYSENRDKYSFGSLKMFPKQNPDAAVFLAGLNELNDSSLSYETPRIIDRQWWIDLKSKIEKSSQTILPSIPVNEESNAVALRNSLNQNNYDVNRINKLRELCSKWAEKSNVPHVTIVVHKGNIIFHETFGKDEDQKSIETETPMWMASITKLLTGSLIMQFVDQDIIDLDSSVGKYLSELQAYKSLTVRDLFTHVSGLHFAGEWASDWNYSLENQIAHVMPTVTVGDTFSYHRVGYALAGKIMERLTGKLLPYLFYHYLFNPLEMKTAFCDNSYGSLYCSAIDLAKFAQMLINKGRYNGHKFFSESTFTKMLPQKLSVGDRNWGIGTSPMNSSGLSDSAFGHGAASGSILKIDPQNELIIISARNTPGKYHAEFESVLIKSCLELIKTN